MSGIRSIRGKIRPIAAGACASAAVLISALHHLTAAVWVHWHNLYQVLYYIPTVLAALLFGWRMGLLVSVIAAVSHLPYIVEVGRTAADEAVEHVAEMGLLTVVALLTGVFSDRDRKQRRELQSATDELSRVYRELQKNFEHMKRAERLFAVGQLAAGLAHEIRNPLWSIGGAAGILERNANLPPKHRECVDIIRKESQRLTRLLTDFLDFARPRSPKFQAIEVAPLLASVVHLGAHGVGHKAVDLRIEAARDLPPFEGDPEMIKQVLLNLLINAIQAMPDGGVVLLVAAAHPGKLLLQVRDEGAGISPEIRDRIFDPFFTTKDGGTGLGLAVAHQIVEQHGGLLKAEANETRGTTFTVVLPLRHRGSL